MDGWPGAGVALLPLPDAAGVDYTCLDGGSGKKENRLKDGLHRSGRSSPIFTFW